MSERDSLRFWEDVLGQVHEDLSLSTEKEKGRVRVVGEWHDLFSQAYQYSPRV